MSAPLHRVCVAGASGRMGQMLVEAVLASGDCELSGALDMASSPAIGLDAGAFAGRDTGARITADFAQGLSGCHALIDFTRPEGTMVHLAACVAHRVNLVIGTTGFSEAQKAQIAEASKSIAIMMAPNMSVGANVTLKLLEMAAKALSNGYDIEIADALGRDLKDCAVYGREGVTGERDPSTIGFATVRGGDIVGDHTVLFAGTGERIEITHKSSSRATYAQGSLRAVRFLAGRSSGLFDMADVLGLR